MSNIMPCEQCGALTSFERWDKSMPHEGEVCDICGLWICNECMDWNSSCRGEYTILCKICVEENELSFKEEG